MKGSNSGSFAISSAYFCASSGFRTPPHATDHIRVVGLVLGLDGVVVQPQHAAVPPVRVDGPLHVVEVFVATLCRRPSGDEEMERVVNEFQVQSHRLDSVRVERIRLRVHAAQ